MLSGCGELCRECGPVQGSSGDAATRRAGRHCCCSCHLESCYTPRPRHACYLTSVLASRSAAAKREDTTPRHHCPEPLHPTAAARLITSAGPPYTQIADGCIAAAVRCASRPGALANSSSASVAGLPAMLRAAALLALALVGCLQSAQQSTAVADRSGAFIGYSEELQQYGHCQDKLPSCEKDASLNKCLTHPYSMRLYCPVSCAVRPCVTTGTALVSGGARWPGFCCCSNSRSNRRSSMPAAHTHKVMLACSTGSSWSQQ